MNAGIAAAECGNGERRRNTEPTERNMDNKSTDNRTERKKTYSPTAGKPGRQSEEPGNAGERMKDFFSREYHQVHDTQTAIPVPVIFGVLIAGLALEVIFVILVLSLALLPLKYVVLIMIILAAIDAGILALILNRRKGIRRFYVGMILTVIMMILLLPAIYFLNSTGDALQRISSIRDQWEDYQVIALENSAYEDLDDINGKTVYCINSNSKMNDEAKERLVTAADVDIEDETDILSLGNRLVDEKGNLHNNLIFTSKSYYKMQCEEIKDFRKNTKVVYTMKVMKRPNENSKRIDVTRDPFNVYITGIDTWGNIDKVSRSDVNMIATINPQTRQILLTSIPRDAYVELHTFGQLDKLTHSGIYGVDETLETVEDWMDIDINYYVKLNFSMVVRLINAIDGIDVYSDKAFKSSVSKYTYEKGWNHMRGKQALFFARERKSFEKGDAERIRNQQKVLKALIRKCTTSRVILTTYPELLDAVADNMVTNMSKREMARLSRMQLRDMDDKWSVKTMTIDCTEAYRGTYSMGMGRKLFVNIPKEESVEKAKKGIHDIMYPAEAADESKPLLP